MKLAAPVVDDLSSSEEQTTRVYTIRQYRMPAKVLHWITAVLVFCMFASGVIAKQLGGGAVADMLMSLHKLTGALTLVVVVARLVYRATLSMPEWRLQAHRRPALHWMLYGIAVLVPLLGWAGISDFGAREIFPGLFAPADLAGGGRL